MCLNVHCAVQIKFSVMYSLSGLFGWLGCLASYDGWLLKLNSLVSLNLKRFLLAHYESINFT